MLELGGEVRIGWADHADGQAARLEDSQRLFQAGRSEGVQHDVVSGQDVGEVLLGEVDDLVGTQSADAVDVVGVSRGGDMGAEVPRDLDNSRSESAGTGVDENLLAGL